MAGNPQPLDQQFAIVEPDGRPNAYFIRWAQARQNDIQDSGVWGSITGTLNDQTDLKTVLDGKLSVVETTTYGPNTQQMVSDPATENAAFSAGDVDKVSMASMNSGSLSNLTFASFNIDLKNFTGGASMGPVGFGASPNRCVLVTYGSVTGWEFSAQPYVVNNKIYHEGILSFGAGLSYNPGTGVLTSTATGAAWGSITGVLSAQADLQAALDAKVDDSQISVYGLTLVAAANAAAARTVLGLAAIASSGSGADLSNGTVTLGKIASQAAATILGNNTGGAASPIALTATQAKTLLAIAAADVSGLAAIATSGSGADLAAATVTYAKIQNVSATDLILGRSSAGAGVIQEIACTAAGRALIAGANIAAQRTTLDVMSTAQVNAAIASGSAAPLEIAPTKPVVANFTLDNGGAGGTMTNGSFGISLIRAAAGGSQISVARSNTTPSAVAFTLTARLTPTYAFFQTGYSACIILRNSTNGRLLIFGDYQGGTNILVQGWSSYSAFANNVLGPASAVGARFPWRRVVLSAGTLDFQCSPDGDVWQSIGTTTVATYLTAAGGGTLDQVGFGEFSTGGTLCQSWTVV